MKKLIISLALAITCTVTTHAQNFGTDLGKVGSDVHSFLTDAGTNNNWGITAGGLYSAKQWGGFADMQYTLVSNSVSTSIGFVSAYIPASKTFYDGSFSCRLSSTIKAPVVGTLGIYAESGPGYSFSSKQAIVQSFTGVEKDILLSNKYHLILGGGAGNISDRSGICYIAHITFIW